VRVCHVTPHLPPEQAANAILPVQLARALAARRVESSFVSHPSERFGPPDGLEPVTFTPKRGAGFLARTPLGALAAAGRMAQDARPGIEAADVVHLHSNGLLIEVAGRVARRRSRPSVITLYGTDVWDHDETRHARFRSVVQSASMRVFYSRALLDFATPLGLAGGPARVIYAPVDAVFDRADDATRAQIRRDLGVSDRRVVLTVKRLHPVAGYLDALAAFQALIPGVPDALWVIAGYGDLRESLEAETRARGLADRIRFLGLTPQSQLPAWYTAADVFLLASRVESWGAVTLEALACGTPVVATATAGSSEVHRLFPDDVTLVPVGDAPALAQETRRALAAPRRTADATARRLDDEFRIGPAAAAYLDVYEHALGRTRRS
jgi:glycosyltransferase involved in cell wall biosynthesis